MHDLEPFYKWREYYIASEDDQSPFYGNVYDEFMFTKKIYNYFIHPQWDEFGSQTLYIKVLYVDYNDGICMIELIGEWNDTIGNDIMFLKRDLVDDMLDKGVYKFIVFCDNVLNFHGDDDSYYEEWLEDVSEHQGYIAFVNLQDHVLREMESVQLQYYVKFGAHLNDVAWRLKTPQLTINHIEEKITSQRHQLRY